MKQRALDMRLFQSRDSIKFESIPSRSIGLNYILPILVALITLAVTPSEALWNKYRSVKRCDPHNKLGQPFQDERDCSNHCEALYVRTSLESMQKNRHLSQSHLNFIGDPTRPQRVECCCFFDALWPEFVRPELIGRQSADRYKTYGKLECLPLVISVNLTPRTKETYDTLCRYLGKKRPLTMLELIRYVDAAHYLNYMAPRHLSIWKTLRLKEVKKLDKEAVSQVRTLFWNELLDVNLGPLETYEGYRLDVSRLKGYIKLKNGLKQALRSPLVARAYDDLVLSHMIVDIAAANSYIQYVNHEELKIPHHLLRGEYDKYDTKNKAIYFTLSGMDCKLLKQTSNKLNIYVSTVKSVSDVLYEKLAYEKMITHYDNLAALEDSKKVYLNLLDVNCH